MAEVELDEKALEAAVRDVCFDQGIWCDEPNGASCDASGKCCRGKLHPASVRVAMLSIRAYLRTAGLVSVPVMKEGSGQ
jgi:hypothetical protein